MRSHALVIWWNNARIAPSSSSQQTPWSSPSLPDVSLSSPKNGFTFSFKILRDSMTSRDSMARSRKAQRWFPTSQCEVMIHPFSVVLWQPTDHPKLTVAYPKPVWTKPQPESPQNVVSRPHHCRYFRVEHLVYSNRHHHQEIKPKKSRKLVGHIDVNETLDNTGVIL